MGMEYITSCVCASLCRSGAFLYFGTKCLNFRDKCDLMQEKRCLPASIQVSDHPFEIQGHGGKEAVVLRCL